MEELQELDEHEELEYFGEAEEAEEASPLLAPSHRAEARLVILGGQLDPSNT